MGINRIGWVDNEHMLVVSPGNCSDLIASIGDNGLSQGPKVAGL